MDGSLRRRTWAMCLSRIFIPVAGSWPSGSGRIVLPPWPPTEWSKPAHHHLGILTGPAWMEVGWRLEGEFDAPPAASSASCSFIPCCCGQVVIVLALEYPLAAACPWILLSAGYLSVYRVPSPQGLELTAVAGGTLRRICTMSKASVRAFSSTTVLITVSPHVSLLRLRQPRDVACLVSGSG